MSASARKLAAEREKISARVEQFRFALAAEPATLPKRPEPIRNNERKLQKVLLTGLDCLPGQEDLFAT